MVRTARSFGRDLSSMKLPGSTRIAKCDQCGKRRPVNVNHVCGDCMFRSGRIPIESDFLR